MQTLAVIGGSGFVGIEGFRGTVKHVETPYGPPLAIAEDVLGPTRVLFVNRHGNGHTLLPDEIPYRAIIFALKKLGATHVIGVSAVGSLREFIEPGDLVVVNQYVDATWGRPSTFFGNGIVGHVNFADPVCPHLAEVLLRAMVCSGTKHNKATLKVMQGPAFSTRAESCLNRDKGIDLIGMTALPEAKLAREAELHYATLAMVTDYDSWHTSDAGVTAEMVARVMAENVEKAVQAVLYVTEHMPTKHACSCATALDTAIVTDPAHIRGVFAESPIFQRVLTQRK